MIRWKPALNAFDLAFDVDGPATSLTIELCFRSGGSLIGVSVAVMRTSTVDVPSTSSSGRSTCESVRPSTPTAPPAPSEPVFVSRNEVPFELL